MSKKVTIKPIGEYYMKALREKIESDKLKEKIESDNLEEKIKDILIQMKSPRPISPIPCLSVVRTEHKNGFSMIYTYGEKPVEITIEDNSH